jgi:hypothetical protein
VRRFPRRGRQAGERSGRKAASVNKNPQARRAGAAVVVVVARCPRPVVSAWTAGGGGPGFLSSVPSLSARG